MKTELVCVLACAIASMGHVEAAELDMGSPTARTPYDQYLGPMWNVLRTLKGAQPDPSKVEDLVRQGRGFRYVFKNEQPYVPQPPDVTESIKAGDCKAKSLWLAWKMNTPKVRFVIGKAKAVSNMSHAWLVWEGPQGWLILDATNFSRPLVPQKLSPSEFIASYSYSPSGRYAHAMGGAAAGARDGDHL